MSEAESAQKARQDAERAAEARRATLEAQEAQRATERALEAHRAAQRGREALEADRALVAAGEAQEAAGRELARMKQNRSNAAEILDGRRELMTGRLKPTGGRFVLPSPPSRLLPEFPDDGMADQDDLDLMWCDADGHVFLGHYEPSLREYEGNVALFEPAHAEWVQIEEARLDWTAREKRAIWDERAPELRRRLDAIEAQGARTGVVGRAVEAARSIFDWMRERVGAARGTLGEQNPTTTALEADWLNAIADHPRAHDAVRDDHHRRTRALKDQARSIWDEGSRLWLDVQGWREGGRRPDPHSRLSPDPRPDPPADVWTPRGPSR